MNEYDELDLPRCTYCELGLHDECLLSQASQERGHQCCCGGVDWSAPFATPKAKGSERALMAPADMDDPRSTGRKRAAMIAPIFQDMVCEWAWLKFAGGGVVPIIGCPGHLLDANTKDGSGGDLHHSPDKNTLNNTPSVNLHRICKSCHHTYHALNDRFYDEPRPAGDKQWLPNTEWVPHDQYTKATEEEVFEAAAGRSATNRRQGDSGLTGVIDLL